MMTIREHLDSILDELGYDAYEAEDERLWVLYEEDFDAFEEECAVLGIDTDAQEIILGYAEYVVNLWAWDHDE